MGIILYFFEFIILFSIIYLYYYLFSLDGIKNLNKKNRKKRIELNKENIKKKFPEEYLLIKKYDINMKKISYKSLGIKVAIMISFNLSLTVIFIMDLKFNFILKVLLGFLLLIILMISGYKVLGNICIKKGMVTDVQS